MQLLESGAQRLAGTGRLRGWPDEGSACDRHIRPPSSAVDLDIRMAELPDCEVPLQPVDQQKSCKCQLPGIQSILSFGRYPLLNDTSVASACTHHSNATYNAQSNTEKSTSLCKGACLGKGRNSSGFQGTVAEQSWPCIRYLAMTSEHGHDHALASNTSTQRSQCMIPCHLISAQSSTMQHSQGQADLLFCLPLLSPRASHLTLQHGW